MAKPNTANTIRIKIEATLPLPEAQSAMLPPKPPCGKCGTCGQHKSSGAGKTGPSASLRMTGPSASVGMTASGTVPPSLNELRRDRCGMTGPLLNHAAEALLNMAAGAYTLEQLSTALEIIETLLRRHYSRQP